MVTLAWTFRSRVSSRILCMLVRRLAGCKVMHLCHIVTLQEGDQSSSPGKCPLSKVLTVSNHWRVPGTDRCLEAHARATRVRQASNITAPPRQESFDLPTR
mmetsp:Transcript_46626/g.107704  ORF Transcript_46626/g.107704 Transcript_46626/m.107704 type:complete len:101 (-) Transcript_46626:2246-2548(-)